jgi:DNA mismatch repair protein MutL
MKDIKKLPQLLIDQIAAGEIIERPASIVKELLENSVDAGATQIHLNLNDGGISLISVLDNGFGITRNNLPLAVRNHATSKIENQNEFENCSSHGFRGEALAAIASVSRLKIQSKTSLSDEGNEIFQENNKWILQPCSGEVGTHISVSELFHKVPARKRFLKNRGTELKHCKSIFMHLSLAHPLIEFNFIHEGKKQLSFKKTSLLERFARVCSVELSQVRILEKTVGEVSIKLLLSSSQENNIRNQEYIIVNKRCVKNYTVSRSINTAFKNLVHELYKPDLLVEILIPNNEINFNVHPTKKEVQFKDNGLIYSLIYETLINSLSNNDLTNRVNTLVLQEDKAEQGHTKKRPRSIINNGNEQGNKFGLRQDFLDIPGQNEFTGSGLSVGLGVPLGQLANTFIVAQNNDGLILIDSHAAHERILFEILKEKSNVACQKLSYPEKIRIDKHDFQAITESLELINSYGFDIQTKQPNELIIRGHPEVLKNINPVLIVRELITEIVQFDSFAILDEKVDEVLGNIACKSAVKANQKLSLTEMTFILRKMEKIENGGICNHGRPTWIQISLDTVGKFFLKGK